MEPIFGRDAEIEQLRSALAAGRGAVVSGTIGIGKTHLLRHVIATHDRSPVHSVIALRDAALSLSALVPTPIDQPTMSEVAANVGAPPTTEGTSRDAIASVVDALAGADVLLAIDDIQWLDDDASTVIAQAAARGVRIVATCRDDDESSDLVRRLIREFDHDRVELGVLSDEALDAVVERLLDNRDLRTSQRIIDLAQGNPLLARELVLDGIDAGSLVRSDGVWLWVTSGLAGRRVDDVVADRLAGLTPVERDGLQALALTEPVPLPAFEALVADDTMVTLERRRLITVDDDRVRLSHPLFGEQMRGALGPIEARREHRRIVERIPLDTLTDDPDVLRWSYWAVEADLALEADVWMRLTRVALGAGDRRHALVLAERARGAGAGREASIAIGRAASLLGDVATAEHELGPIALDTNVPQSERVEAARYLLYAFEFGPHDWEAEQRLARDVIDSLPDDDDRAEIAVQWATSLTQGARFEAAGEIAIPLLDHPTPRISLRALTPATAALLSAGRCRTATAAAEERLGLALAHHTTIPEGTGWVFTAMCTGYLYNGRIDALSSSAALALDGLASRQDGEGADHARAVVLLASGRAAFLAGRLQAARADFVAALAVYRRHDPQLWRSLAAANVAETAALTGLNALSISAAEEARSTEPFVSARATDIERGLAWHHLAVGDFTAARQALTAVAKSANADGFLPAEIFALHDLVRLGDRRGAREMRRRSPQMDSDWTPAFAAMADGVIDGQHSAFQAAAQHFEQIGAWLFAAEAWCAGSVAARDEGRSSTAQSLGQRTRIALEHTDGVDSPTLRGLNDVVALTQREQQIAVLAAGGASSRQIGSELGVSPRTVDNLLARVYQKLDISRRADLPGALGLDPTPP